MNSCSCRSIPLLLRTTLSSLKEWRRVYGEPVDTLPERTIEYFYDHPLYIEALVKNIGKILRQFPTAPARS